jgi:hypothetical protein
MVESKPVDNVPVEDVGGTQSGGRWPVDKDEISVGDTVTRPVRLDDGTEEDLEVTITGITQIVRDDGTETDGYSIAFTHGGGQ